MRKAPKSCHVAVDLVAAYLAHVPEDEPRPLAVEVTMESLLVDPRTGEDFGIPLLGIVDLVLGGQDGPVIADFKTAARGGIPAEITHEIQLSSYAYLFRRLDGRKEAGLEIRSLIKTKVPQIEFHRYEARSDNHIKRLFAVIREYLNALDSGRFNFRPGWPRSAASSRMTWTTTSRIGTTAKSTTRSSGERRSTKTNCSPRANLGNRCYVCGMSAKNSWMWSGSRLPEPKSASCGRRSSNFSVTSRLSYRKTRWPSSRSPTNKAQPRRNRNHASTEEESRWKP